MRRRRGRAGRPRRRRRRGPGSHAASWSGPRSLRPRRPGRGSGCAAGRARGRRGYGRRPRTVRSGRPPRRPEGHGSSGAPGPPGPGAAMSGARRRSDRRREGSPDAVGASAPSSSGSSRTRLRRRSERKSRVRIILVYAAGLSARLTRRHRENAWAYALCTRSSAAWRSPVSSTAVRSIRSPVAATNSSKVSGLARHARRLLQQIGHHNLPEVRGGRTVTRLLDLVRLDRGVVEPLPGAVEPLLAQRRQLLAALPERERLLQGGAAGLEPTDHLDQLLTGGLVGRLLVAHRVSSGSVFVVVAWMRPSATRTLICCFAVTASIDVTTWPSASWSTAYPRCRVASGDSARARARWWPMSSPARSRAWRRVRRARSRSLSTSSSRASTRVRGSASAGRERERVEAGLLTGQPAGQVAAQPFAGTGHLVQLLHHVGHHQLGGVGGGGGPDVGDQVEQRLVGLVADRRDQGGADPGDRADQALVGEGQQVLDRPAAAGDHDHLDGRVAVEPLDGLDHLGRGSGALHRGVRRLEGHRRPAAPGVLEDVALGGGAGRRDQPDDAGQERQPALEREVEEALGREQLAAPLEPGEQLAEPDHPDVAGVERQAAAVGVVGGLGVHDHARPLDQRRVEAVEEAARAGHGDRDVRDGVAQGHEDGVQTRPAAHLRDLTLHPHRAEPVDPARDRVGDLPDRGR